MYGYIYITTNLINNRKYIGQKKSDYFKGTDYLGSGKILKQAVAKYGYENFKVDLLEECSSKEELDCQEKYWIKKYNAVDSPEFYNIAFGGQSRVHRQSEESKRKLRVSHLRENLSEETLRRMSLSQKARMVRYGNPFKGKHHTEESKKKLAVAHLRENLPTEVRQSLSQQCSQRNRGRVWVNDGVHNKFINSSDLGSFQEQGFVLGRLHIDNSSHAGTFFVTDGVHNKLVKSESQIPSGWWKGMTRKN